jgi:hypothetical protein
MGEKAAAADFQGRFREIVSDPLNIAIRRSPNSGRVNGSYVHLHNGLRVPIEGPFSYYHEFSRILCINRGVHEPLEEFVFQEVLQCLPLRPRMVELGAYWGHYSMWLQKEFPHATVHLVEPDPNNLKAGIHNFEINGLTGDFIEAFVGKGHFEVDRFLMERRIPRLDILHSDIQGYEVEMLEGCSIALTKRLVDYVFVSTHSQSLHSDVLRALESVEYRIEVSADFESETTSFDGFVLASSPSVKPVFSGFVPMGRVTIEGSDPSLLSEYISSVIRSRRRGRDFDSIGQTNCG